MIELRTVAERHADKARDLSAFSGFALPAVREKIAELLGLIGREGIFSTYTVHDIRHIDAMLKMLDWLIPEATAKIMTPADWLLTVLAIYMHDLGMLVTADEFCNRHKNPEYASWFGLLSKTVDGREYIGRAERMTDDEKERFFFQEFVRKGHAQRIREWITGRHSRLWGPNVKPITITIEEALRPLPSRFRDYLGLVCESHHKAGLDNVVQYPLVARFGSDPNEVANIQYAAILLRTADLLHVTKDRTPSEMFQLIRFSDPKSVSEWGKQGGAFAVGPKGRRLVESDPETASIQVDADFSDERPLFALQEYVAYADREVKQSRRWIEKSQESPNGEDYSYPWHEVTGDIRLEGVPPQPLRFELDRGRLLDLLVGHTIYNDPTVAVRELLQNAIDAVRFQHFLNKKSGRPAGDICSCGNVQVRWNNTTRVLVIEDNGIGMDRDVIRHHLMSVGTSYYNTPQFEIENRDFAAISRFGIGILTCFMVSDDIEIITNHSNKGHRIRMTSVQSTYLLRELDGGDALLSGLEPLGTRVSIRVRSTVDLEKRSMEDIVRYWIILPECPVAFIEDDKAPQRIGFDSPADALEHYLAPVPKVGKSYKTEILSSQKQAMERSGDYEVGVLYDMAFAVNPAESHIPERSFASVRPGNVPAVCIEGIRVSNNLPGFEEGGRDSPISILSVRGSRKCRTTVSRDGLEIDEEYENIARLVSEMLFSHVGHEVSRIADKPGKPLSVASSVATYLFRSLATSARRPKVRERLQSLIDCLPCIVVETVEYVKELPHTTRSLMSAEQLRGIASLWTVDSRSLESLGVISRDLGRELSLNDFLVKLAPEITQLRYSPMLPDAQQWVGALRKLFRPQRVEFSRAHQQSAVQWVRLAPGEESTELKLRDHIEPLLLARVTAKVTAKVADRMPQNAIKTIYSMDTAEVVGDDPRVKLVVSGTGTVFQTGSDISKIWSAIVRRIKKPGSPEEVPLSAAVYALALFESFFNMDRNDPWIRRGYSGGPQTESALLEELERACEECGGISEFPPTWKDAFKREEFFEARNLWRRWWG